MSKPEFDDYSASYGELIGDPIRDRFAVSADFFHKRKRDLVRDYFRNRRDDTRQLRYLDVGCGKGDLLSLLSRDFAHAAGCDPSTGMLQGAAGMEVRVQDDPGRIPFEDAQFDFVTAVCVYHHVPPPQRAGLTAEIRRVVRPGGTFAIIEHNPFNPVTSFIVSRSPVDVDAVLLRASETRSLMRGAGFAIDRATYFGYFPEKLYRVAGAMEKLFTRLPIGGQYAVFARAALPGKLSNPS